MIEDDGCARNATDNEFIVDDEGIDGKGTEQVSQSDERNGL